MAEPAPDHVWKDRYRELLRDFENKEREWAALETALRTAASRVAIAALGQSEALDAALEPLVESLRTKGTMPELDTSTTSLLRALKLHETVEVPAAPDLAKLLAGLVRSLGRVPGFAPAEAALAQRLAAGIEPNGWAAFLDEVARSVRDVVETLHAQRTELAEFLEQVTRQLALLEAWTAWQSDAVKSRRDDTLGLERTFETEMGALLRDVDSSPDLGALKSNVQSRLDAVTRQLHEFRAGEERRAAESEQHAAALGREVLRLKARTSALTELCAAQEERLAIDSLTGVHSRYAYEQRLIEEHERWLRYGHPLTYVIGDIDDFKRINDQFGHEAGDRLLRAVAGILSQHKRQPDFLARLGGEEFALLLPGTALEAGTGVADKLRRAIEAATFQHKGRFERVTISCGLTEFRPGDTPAAVYERADRALYAAKRQGRNRCVAQ
jgi:diguanylate cyclase